MGKISLKVEIAGRTYPLTVQEGEEKKVLNKSTKNELLSK
jgi:hypothetical protein